MGKGLTYSYVYSYFKEQGCVLLEDIYIDSITKMRYQCSCGNISKISWSAFKAGNRCKKCGYQRRVKDRKLNFKNICEYFNKYNCEVLESESDYVNVLKKIKYKCNCGNITYTKWYTFTRSKTHKCRRCNTYTRYSYKYVKEFFEKHDCTLLEKNYKGCLKIIKYRCACGNTAYTTFSMFKQGHRCKQCGKEKTAKYKRYSFEYIKNFFKNQGCVLLEKEYTNMNYPLKYRCSCGNVSNVSFSHFMRGNRCAKCAGIKTAERLRYDYNFVKNYFESQGCLLLSKSYEQSNKKLKYKCNCGNISYVCFNNFLRGTRCHHCKSSRGEKLIRKVLIDNNIPFESPKSFTNCKYKRKLAFDFYIPRMNMCIEYDGQFHYEPKLFKDSQNYLKNYETQKIRDNIKNEYCKENKIKLLRIPYWEFNNIENILYREKLLICRIQGNVFDG